MTSWIPVGNVSPVAQTHVDTSTAGPNMDFRSWAEIAQLGLGWTGILILEQGFNNSFARADRWSIMLQWKVIWKCPIVLPGWWRWFLVMAQPWVLSDRHFHIFIRLSLHRFLSYWASPTCIRTYQFQRYNQFIHEDQKQLSTTATLTLTIVWMRTLCSEAMTSPDLHYLTLNTFWRGKQ